MTRYTVVIEVEAYKGLNQLAYIIEENWIRALIMRGYEERAIVRAVLEGQIDFKTKRGDKHE